MSCRIKVLTNIGRQEKNTHLCSLNDQILNVILHMEGPLQIKTTDFAVELIRYCHKLPAEFKDVKSQIIRSGTSIGANVAESVSAVSKKDYIYKLGIALKEARETTFWLSILSKFDTVNKEKTSNLKNDVNEIIKILSSIILTIKKKYNI